MEKQYNLAEACGNSFVIFDCLTLSDVNKEFLKKAHACLLKEQRDDALILVDGEEKNDALYGEMLVLGADGVLAEYCGNGSRACAAYLFKYYPRFKHYFIKNKKASYQLLRYAEHIYSAQLAPANFVPNIKFIAKTDVFNKNDNGIYSFVYEGKRIFYVEVMEPNLILNEKMSNHELFSLGRKLNQHADLFPIGININACVILPDNVLQVMTYERGVQRLTLSCGTGATAAVALYLNRTQGNVNVITLGGLLEIRVDKINIELKGPATLE